MKTVLRIGAVLVVVAALVAAGVFFLRQQGSPAAADETQATATVTRGDIEEMVSARGNVAADQQITLAFASSGAIAEVLIAKGQEVEAGDLLARLDDSALQWQITRAEASLDTAQARLEQAKQPASAEELASAQASLDNALVNLETVKEGATVEELASARAALDSARANYDKVKAGPTKEDLAAARATLDSAKAAVRQAQAAYDRVSYAPDIASRQESLNLQNATTELERAQANYDAVASRPTASELASAKAQVASAESQLALLLERPGENELAAAEAQVVSAETQLAQLQERPKAEDVAVFESQVQEAEVALAQAQSQLDDALITAPFGGVILAVEIRDGEWATPGAPAIELAATEPLVLDVNVDEVDIAQVAEGQKAHLKFDALNDTRLDGEVSYIAPASTNVGGAVAYGVEVSFSSGEEPVRLGMTADVDIVVGSAEGVLLIPNRAITADRAAGRYYVDVPGPEGTTRQVEVTIGLRDETQTQIVEGLEEGAVVVLPQLPDQTERRFGPPGSGGSFGGGGQ